MARTVLFKNFTVITPTKEGRLLVLKDACVAVKGDRIIYVGEDRSLAVRALMEAQRESGGTQIGFDEYNGKNKILLPPFANPPPNPLMPLMPNTADVLRRGVGLFRLI